IGPYNYSWSSGSSNSSLTSLTAGTYTLVVNDANNCTYMSQVTIGEPAALTASVSSANVLCNGDTSGNASAIVAGGLLPYNINWNSGAVQVNPMHLVAGNYHMQVTDVNGCTLIENFVITEPPVLQISGNSTDVLCHGDSTGIIQAIVSGGVSPYNYLWNTGATAISVQSLLAGTYDVIVTDSNNCLISDSYSISEPLLLVAEVISDSLLCIDQSASVHAFASGGSGVNYEYYLNGIAMGGPGPFNFLAATDTCISLYVTDGHGCASEMDTTCVLVYPELNVLASAEDTICFGDTITLSSQASGGNGGPYYYNWGYLGNGQTVQTVPMSYPYYSNYIVSATDSCSPMAYDTVVVGFYNMPQEIITLESTQGCVPLDMQVTNNSTNSSYCAWSMGNGDSLFNCGSFIYTYDTPGTYVVSVELENVNGCKSSVDTVVTVEAYSLPIADFKYAPLEVELPNAEIDFYNNSIDAISFEWHFGDGNISYDEHPTHVYADSGTYTVTLYVENDFGCRDSQQLTVVVHMNLIVYIPNSFSPNFDGTNDLFYPKGVGISDEGYLLAIYNRWGDKIYETTDARGYWDGTIKHSKNIAPQGVYLYLITVRDYKNEPHYLTGTVTVVR
ncbi:MAG: PKD domain-containing protein, partial [Bacteroidia bacterium]|nr:PKD domain-containing protein [Bacteroidia bacterium]